MAGPASGAEPAPPPEGTGSVQDVDRTVVVAVLAVDVVQTAVHQVVEVVAVGHLFVPTGGAVHMAGFVSLEGDAARRIAIADLERVLEHDARGLLEVQVPVVQVPVVIVVPHAGVPAARSVDVVVVRMVVHGFLSLAEGFTDDPPGRSGRGFDTH